MNEDFNKKRGRYWLLGILAILCGVTGYRSFNPLTVFIFITCGVLLIGMCLKSHFTKDKK